MSFFLPFLLWQITQSRWESLLNQGRVIKNFQGKIVLTPYGLPLTVILVVTFILSPLWGVPPALAGNLILLFIFAGFTGFIDDFYGKEGQGKKVKGLRGHLKAFFQGHLTSGTVKLTLLLLSGFYFTGIYAHGTADFLSGLLLIPLSANLINLLDLRPGRAVKGFWLFSLPLLFNGIFFWQIYLPILGVLLPYFQLDMKERGMLGDTGANVLGAMLGFFYLYLFDWKVQSVITVLFFALNLAAEKYSFSALIERNKILSFLDNAGRESK